MRFLVVVATVVVSACASVVDGHTDPAMYFTELNGGTCGSRAPVSDLADVCGDLRGVRSSSTLEQRWFSLDCNEGTLASLHWDSRTRVGAFELELDDCRSSYDISDRPNYESSLERKRSKHQ